MCKSWKYFEKGQPHACDYHTHETARICPDNIKEINDPILRKLSERRADGQTNGQTKKDDFIARCPTNVEHPIS